MSTYPFMFKLGESVRVSESTPKIGGRSGTIRALELSARGTTAAVITADGHMFRVEEHRLRSSAPAAPGSKRSA